MGDGAARDDVIAFASELLDLDAYPDYGPMGMQVAGAERVRKIACGVSASRELFERSGGSGAQLLLVHHGLFWKGDSPVIDPVARERLRALFDADLTLAAYHLALDAHAEVGNNALLAGELGVRVEDRFADVGWGGRLPRATSIDELVGRVREAVGREPVVFAFGSERVERVAICSGGAPRLLPQAAAEGYDCYMTGEPAEPSKHLALEHGIHFVAAGHYATETLGVQALAARLAERFSLEWEFIDVPNPV
ncbi:MAG: Nif3-like dinuclear metal center hexameric protein [Actinobacteria bacterium]|nr:MAG: Nif3-like dinuclear metal center hexameric protein [Actinomycetota bacterium]